MAAGESPEAVPIMNNGLLRLMLQRRGGTQVYVENLCCWQVKFFQGAAAAIAWAGAMKLCHISFLPLLRIQEPSPSKIL